MIIPQTWQSDPVCGLEQRHWALGQLEQDKAEGTGWQTEPGAGGAEAAAQLRTIFICDVYGKHWEYVLKFLSHFSLPLTTLPRISLEQKNSDVDVVSLNII